MEYAVIVAPGKHGETCRVRGKDQECANRPRLTVCLCLVSDLDGPARSSSIDSCCCEHHLPLAIREAHAEVRERAAT